MWFRKQRGSESHHSAALDNERGILGPESGLALRNWSQTPQESSGGIQS